MAITLTPQWLIDNVALPRNPNSFKYTFDKVNATYEKQADGRQIRISAPKLQTAIDIVLTWKYAPRRIIRSILQYCNRTTIEFDQPHIITITGIQPPLIIKGWFDTPEITMSQENVTSRVGEGGTFQDLQLTLRSDAFGFQSANFIPTGSSAIYATIASNFGGIIGNSLDYLPASQWDGVSYWQQPFASSTNMTIWNLGDQQWYPMIQINGPFTSFTLIQNSIKLSYAAQLVQFLWTGGAVASGNAVIYDMMQNRCYLVTASGTVNTEVYTYALQTTGDNLPFGYYPGLVVGSNSFSILATGSFTAATNIDFS